MSKKNPTRQERWNEAIGELRAGLSSLEDVWYEYHNWHESLPENLLDSPVGEKLQEVMDLPVEEIESLIEECDAAELPLGFGRD